MIKIKIKMINKNENENENENVNDNLYSIDIEGIRTVFFFFYVRYFKYKKTQTKALQVTSVHKIYTNKSTSSNFYPYNIHK